MKLFVYKHHKKDTERSMKKTRLKFKTKIASHLRYDLEIENNHNFIANGIVVHNSNCKIVYDGARTWVGSRNQWVMDDPSNIWWKAFRKYPQIEQFCRDFPNTIIYGEVYGQVQDLRYDHGPGEVSIALFDIMDSGKWWDPTDYDREKKMYDLPWAPEILRPDGSHYVYGVNDIFELAEGKSLIASHCKEGVVVRPMIERYFGKNKSRCVLKIVGNEYLSRK